MTFFQNPFLSDFEGNWLLGDRHHIPKFVCPHNAGRGDEHVVTWAEGPYDLSGVDSDGTNDTDTLVVVYALNDQPKSGVSFKNWATISIDITATAASISAVRPEEIVTDLNADATFAERFEALLQHSKGEGAPNAIPRVVIRQRAEKTNFRFYIQNGRAEDVLQFNQRAGVAELPTFFGRHTIANRFTFTDNQNHIIALDPTDGVDARIIDDAVDAYGNSLDFTSATVQEDWELLAGRSGLFDFTSDDGSGTVIIYPAGAKAGDLAKKIVTNGGNTFVLPYTLESGDLITPP
jgi:hypothetical protein